MVEELKGEHEGRIAANREKSERINRYKLATADIQAVANTYWRNCPRRHTDASQRKYEALSRATTYPEVLRLLMVKSSEFRTNEDADAIISRCSDVQEALVPPDMTSVRTGRASTAAMRMLMVTPSYMGLIAERSQIANSPRDDAQIAADTRWEGMLTDHLGTRRQQVWTAIHSVKDMLGLTQGSQAAISSIAGELESTPTCRIW